MHLKPLASAILFRPAGRRPGAGVIPSDPAVRRTSSVVSKICSVLARARSN
jgi:hypothetical protein